MHKRKSLPIRDFLFSQFGFLHGMITLSLVEWHLRFGEMCSLHLQGRNTGEIYTANKDQRFVIVFLPSTKLHGVIQLQTAFFNVYLSSVPLARLLGRTGVFALLSFMLFVFSPNHLTKFFSARNWCTLLISSLSQFWVLRRPQLCSSYHSEQKFDKSLRVWISKHFFFTN